jgi:hypothetical protein
MKFEAGNGMSDETTQGEKGPRRVHLAGLLGAVGVICLVLGFVAGSNYSPASTSGETIAATPSAEHDPSDAVAAAEANVGRLQERYDAALDNVGFGDSGGTYPPDPQILAGMRRATELEELACREYGTACEEAKLLRRQLNEMQSGH